MRHPRLSLALALAFVAALAAGSSVPASAQWTPATLPLISFLGVSDTMSEACDLALAELEESCQIHGAVSYDRGRCITTYPPFLDPVTLCDCKAQTRICINSFPF